MKNVTMAITQMEVIAMKKRVTQWQSCSVSSQHRAFLAITWSWEVTVVWNAHVRSCWSAGAHFAFWVTRQIWRKTGRECEQVQTQRGKHAQTMHTRKDPQPQKYTGHAGLRHNKMPSHTHHISTDFTSSMVPSGNKDAAGLKAGRMLSIPCWTAIWQCLWSRRWAHPLTQHVSLRRRETLTQEHSNVHISTLSNSENYKPLTCSSRREGINYGLVEVINYGIM